jgi:antagonist of KipI
MLGPTIEFECAATIAICGARMSAPVPMNQAFQVLAGTRIAIGSLAGGARAYLAVRGGLAVPLVMNSCSTFLPAGIGGHEGRALRTGDLIPIGEVALRSPGKLRAHFADHLQVRGPIRVTRSLQSEWFNENALQRFQAEPFTIQDESNRAGIRLRGESVQSLQRGELVTEGIALGAIQVPPDGQPIILVVDQQTTGGYPKIANVIAADLPRIGQLRPRDEVRFQFVSIPEAVEALRQQERAVQEAFAR